MTDNEIIKALECCSDITFRCDGCPLQHLKYSECYELMTRSTLNLINRQKAEIERLNSPYEMQVEASKKLENSIKAEAVKEFAERLKEKLHLNGVVVGSNCAIVEDTDIDNLVKEMVGADGD